VPNIDLGINVTVFNNASGGLKNIANGVKQIGENAQAAHNRLKAIQVVIAGIVIDKVLEYGRAFVAAADKNESARNRLVAFTGSLAAASKVSGELAEKFRSTGFDVTELGDDFVRLHSAVKSSREGLDLIEAIANDVAALGGNNRNIDNVSESFQRMGGRGVASMRDLNAILQNTPLTLADLAKAAGETSTAFEGNLRNGFLHGGALIDDFIKASKTKVGDYAEYLKGTLAGGIGDIKNSLDEALGSLGERTNANTQLAVVFHNIAEAVRDFIGAIDQQKIDAFFEWARNMEPIIAKLIVSIEHIGEAIFTVATLILNALGNMPQDALEMGLLGYMIFGKRGFMIGALLETAGNGVASLMAKIGVFPHGPNGQSFLQNLSSLLPGGLSSGENPMKGFKSILPTPEEIAKMEAALKGLHSKSFGPGGTGGEDSYAEQQARLAAEALKTQIEGALKTINDSIDKLHFKNIGDELGASLSDINKNADQFNAQLDKSLEEIKRLKLPMDDQAAVIKAIGETEARNNAERAIAIQRATELYNIKREQFGLEQQILQAQLQQQARELIQNSNPGAQFNLIRGTAGGQLAETIQAQQVQFMEQSLDLSNKILAAQTQIRDVQADPEKVTQLQDTIQKYQELKAATDDAMKNLSVEGELAKEQWKSIGSTLHNDVADGILGLIGHTETFGQVMTKVWSDITQSVIQYLLKLAEAKAEQSLLGSTGGTGGSGGIGDIFASILGSFANGGAFKGQITPFANGGLVQGPTLFGLAGEAGDEAIMPLTRIGGKLGVHASGSGGDQYHIHVQAIDTQTGMEFIAQHIDTIHQNLSHQKTLNRAGHG
jgi:tape measure domain-containing protein